MILTGVKVSLLPCFTFFLTRAEEFILVDSHYFSTTRQQRIIYKTFAIYRSEKKDKNVDE